MTAGITGVFWLPRMAEANSIALESGAHAVPIAAAGTAWGALGAAWIEATATVTRVIAELGAGLEGVNGLTVLARLGGFAGWTEQQGVQAAVMAGKAFANATAYTVASAAMPSLPEIVAVETARVAAHSTGGALNGSAEAAEAAKLALDIRAALVMETYEAATGLMIATPAEFPMPPPIAAGAGSTGPASPENACGGNGDPVSAALTAFSAAVADPAVGGVVTEAAQVAGTLVASGAVGVGSIAGEALSSLSGRLAGDGTGLPDIAGAVPAAGVGTALLATRAVSCGSPAIGFGKGGGSTALPEGWGAGHGNSGGTTTLASIVEPPSPAVTSGVPVRSAIGDPAAGRDDEDEESHGTQLCRTAEIFADGRIVAPAVIGGPDGAR